MPIYLAKSRKPQLPGLLTVSSSPKKWKIYFNLLKKYAVCPILFFFFWSFPWHMEVSGPENKPLPQQCQCQILSLLSHQRTPLLLFIEVLIWSLIDAIKPFRSSYCGSAVRKSTSIHEDEGWIPGPDQWIKDLTLHRSQMHLRSGVAVAEA